MPRILGGTGKGRRLRAPAGGGTRPTGVRVRRTLFDVLGEEVVGCRLLDPLAGSGTIGLEAAARGAARVVLSDSSPDAVRAMRHNVGLLGDAGNAVRVERREAGACLRALGREGERFDVVYLDPPYESTLYEELLRELESSELLAPGGVVVVEHFHKRPVPATIGSLERTREVRVGEHRLSFYRRSGRSA